MEGNGNMSIKKTNKNKEPRVAVRGPKHTRTDERRQQRTPTGLNFFLNKRITIVTMDSKRIEGILYFISTYDFMIALLDKEGTRTGTYMTIFKHAVKHVRCEDPN